MQLAIVPVEMLESSLQVNMDLGNDIIVIIVGNVTACLCKRTTAESKLGSGLGTVDLSSSLKVSLSFLGWPLSAMQGSCRRAALPVDREQTL